MPDTLPQSTIEPIDVAQNDQIRVKALEALEAASAQKMVFDMEASSRQDYKTDKSLKLKAVPVTFGRSGRDVGGVTIELPLDTPEQRQVADLVQCTVEEASRSEDPVLRDEKKKMGGIITRPASDAQGQPLPGAQEKVNAADPVVDVIESKDGSGEKRIISCTNQIRQIAMEVLSTPVRQL